MSEKLWPYARHESVLPSVEGCVCGERGDERKEASYCIVDGERSFSATNRNVNVDAAGEHAASGKRVRKRDPVVSRRLGDRSYLAREGEGMRSDSERQR